MAANFESGFVVREPAWHGLATVVQDAPNSEEALKLAGLDWKVLIGNAFLQTQDGQMLQTDKKITYRDTDGAVLGFVSGQYSVVQNNEAFAFTDELIGTGEVTYESAGSLDGGKKVFMLAHLPETSILGDRVVPYMLFSNSHDGSASVRVTATPVRVVCENTLNVALKNASRIWSFTHRGNIEEKVHEAQLTLRNMKEYMNELNKEAENVARVKISKIDLQNFLNEIFPIEGEDFTERKAKNMLYLREMFVDRLNVDDLGNFRNTGWGLINAASDFAGHVEPVRKTKTHKEKVLLSFMNGNKIIDTTYDFINSIAA